MKLNASLIGTELKSYRKRISWRETTNYAAAVSDINPAYFDDERKGGIAGHPLFPVAVTWPVLSRLDQFIESKDFPMDVLLTQVHYSEHLVLHRLIRPGDDLSLTGTLKAFLPHRAGTHAVICLLAKDAGGNPVFTEYIGAMLRGVACEKKVIAGTIPTAPDPEITGEILWESDIYIDPASPYLYDGCTNIEFPIHTSPKFAKAVGLPGIIFQGTATLALAVRELVNKEAKRDPSRVACISCRFTGMVVPGSSITVCCTGKKGHDDFTDVFFEVRNSQQEMAIRGGYVKIMKRGTL